MGESVRILRMHWKLVFDIVIHSDCIRPFGTFFKLFFIVFIHLIVFLIIFEGTLAISLSCIHTIDQESLHQQEQQSQNLVHIIIY